MSGKDLIWHEGKHPWESHDGHRRHQHSLNGALTIAPGDTMAHFSFGPPFKEEPVKTGIVKLSDIATEPGAPLTPDYWLGRREGEHYPDYRARQETLKNLKISRNHLTRALAQLDEQIKKLSE